MVDDYYFNNIDTEAKAYFVGYLLADGCINKSTHGGYNVVQLHLSTKDIDIIYYLQEETSNTRKIYIDKDYTRCAYRATSQIMVDDLARFGIVPRKTGIENPDFSTIPDELMHHAIRGLIDGDGWISISNTSTGKIVTSLGICGSYETCQFVTNELAKRVDVGILSPSKVKDKNCYKIGYTSLSDAKTIINFLYKDSTVRLERKYNKAMEILGM
jgi:hypothetical protein